MELILDEHTESVLEFMQQNIPTNKLVGVAQRLPEMAKLLWDRYPQESVDTIRLHSDAVTLGRELQPVATGSGRDSSGAGGGSVAATDARK